MLSTVFLAVAGLASTATAHKGCGGQEGLGRRNELITGSAPSSKFGKRQNTPTTATADCNAYYYAPASALVKSYPTTWQTATIQPGDSDAQNAYNAISAKLTSSFPNDQPHGQPNGNWSGVTYNGGEDPDCWWTYTNCVTPKNSTGLPPDITTVPEPGSWGLTVDDGPNCNNQDLYSYFNANKLRATLFYIGSNVMNWPLQAVRGIEDSHEICVHTWSHQYMTALTDEEVFAELYYTRKIIKDLLNVTATCWRPPYGDVDNRVRLVANELGLRTIIWSEDTDDWSEGTGTPATTIDANYQGIIDKQKNNTYGGLGPIVLTHELTNFTMNELIKFLPQIQSTFAHVINVATAYNNTSPYVEKKYVYPTFEQFIAGQDNVTTTSVPPSSSTSSSSATSSTSAAAAATSSGSSDGTGTNGKIASSGPSQSASSAREQIRGLSTLTTSAAGMLGMVVVGAIAVMV